MWTLIALCELLIIDFGWLWSVEKILTNIFQFYVRWSEIKQLATYILACVLHWCLACLFLAAFAVRSLLAVLLCQAATNEESSSWEYSCAWHQLRTLRKKLGRRGCGNYWFFLTSSFFSILPRCAPSNTSFIRKHALWGCLTVFSVKYFRE